MSYPIYVNTDYIVDKDYRTTPLNTVAVFQINSTTGVSFENAYRVYGAGGLPCFYGENSIYIPQGNKITTFTNTGILAGGGAGGGIGNCTSTSSFNRNNGNSGTISAGNGGCGGGGGGGRYGCSNSSNSSGQNGTNGNDYGYGIGGLGGNNGAGGNGGSSTSITSGSGGSGGYGIENDGSIDTICNLQGGIKTFPLYLNGQISNNYNIIINDFIGQYGQLVVSGINTGKTIFGIDPSSVFNIERCKFKIYSNIINNESYIINKSGIIESGNDVYKWKICKTNLKITNIKYKCIECNKYVKCKNCKCKKSKCKKSKCKKN